MQPLRSCRYCPAPAHRHPHSVTCGQSECKKQHNRDRCREQQRRLRAEYAARGESYRARWGWNSYGNQIRRRQLIDAGDAIDRDKLGERDGWVCGLCQEPVDPNLPYPDPMSASTDHIVPLSPRYGGTHTWDNVQIAHNRCNVSKKDRLEWAPEVAA